MGLGHIWHSSRDSNYFGPDIPSTKKNYWLCIKKIATNICNSILENKSLYLLILGDIF